MQHTRVCTCTRTRVHATCVRTLTSARARVHARVCACTHARMCMQPCTRADVSVRTHIFTYAHIHCSSKSPLSAALAVGYVHSFCAVAGLISLIAGQKPRWYILHSHIRNVLVVFAYYLCDGCESKVCFGFVCVGSVNYRQTRKSERKIPTASFGVCAGCACVCKCHACVTFMCVCACV